MKKTGLHGNPVERTTPTATSILCTRDVSGHIAALAIGVNFRHRYIPTGN